MIYVVMLGICMLLWQRQKLQPIYELITQEKQHEKRQVHDNYEPIDKTL